MPGLTVTLQILDIFTQHLEVTLVFGTIGKHMSHLRGKSDTLVQIKKLTCPLWMFITIYRDHGKGFVHMGHWQQGWEDAIV